MATSSFADPALASAPARRRRLPLAADRRGRRRRGRSPAIVAASRCARAASRTPRPRYTAPRQGVLRRRARRLAGARRHAELRAVPGAPAAVLRRADGTGVVVIRERPALAGNGRSLTRDLTAQIARRFKGVRPVTSRTVTLAGGPAYVYTFARPTAGRVQSIAVAPRAGRTYTLDAVAGAGARDVAAQVGAIVRSFATTNPVPHS